jgi:Fur family transcriptional regulator, ferric uptake regulator
LKPFFNKQMPISAFPDNPLEDWFGRLQTHGYRLTAPRRAVVDVIARSRQALSPGQVHQQARRRYPSLGLVTVYRTLEKLEALGLIQRVHQPGGCHTFIAAAAGHQHLLICQGCGLAEYFSGDDLDTLMSYIGRRSGYAIREHWLQLFGLCADCKKSD